MGKFISNNLVYTTILLRDILYIPNLSIYIIGMNKYKKIGILLLLTPIFIISLTLLLYAINLTSIGGTVFLSLFILTPLTFGLSIIFFIKEKTTLSNLKKYTITKYKSIKKYLKKENKNVDIKRIVYPIVVVIGVIISIAILLLDITLIKDELSIFKGKPQNNEKIYPLKTQEVRVIQIKEDLVPLFPKKYEIISKLYEEPTTADEGCIPLFEIYPKEYTEKEREYLASAFLTYCKDINTAVIESQIVDVRYNSKEDSWFSYFDENDTSGILQEKKTFGSNIVTISGREASMYSGDLYIVRIDNSDEVLMLEIPAASRIHCEVYDKQGVESWKQECIVFLDSMNIPCAGNGWIFDDVYDKYYNDLLEILPKINTTSGSKDDVLGEMSDKEYQEWFEKEADRIVNTYDFSNKEIKPLIQIPEYKFSTNKDIYEQSYKLSSNDTIKVSCNKLKSEYTPVYDVHSCDVFLNSTEAFTAWSWTDNVTIDPHITIFDNKILRGPLVVVGKGFGYGSRDDLSVYIVKDSKLVNLKFNANGERKETWWVDSYTKMYIENGKEYLVTYFHDPAMLAKSLTRVWEVTDTELKLIETILERGY